MDLKAILVFVAIGLASPVLGYWAHLLIDWHRTRKAQQFLEADPLVFEGSRFRKLLTADGGQLMGPGRIAEIEDGRLLAVSNDGSACVPFDAQEFKSMYPHWLRPDPEASGPQAAPPRDQEETYA